jgi:hypothetical protein
MRNKLRNLRQRAGMALMGHRAQEHIRTSYNVVAALTTPDHGALDNDELKWLHKQLRRKEAVLSQRVLPSGVLDARVSHNVLVNLGRTWIRNNSIARAFPDDGDTAASANADLGTLYSVLPSPAVALAGSGKTYKLRYVAVGTGGVLQAQVGAPVATPTGTFTGVVTREGLERPYTVTGSDGDTPSTAVWLRQITGFTDMTITGLIPDPYTARCRAQFIEGDISYVGSHDSDGSPGTDYTSGGTVVPISEALLLTSEANPVICPIEDGLLPVPGSAAYDPFVNLNKTTENALEIVWDFML